MISLYNMQNTDKILYEALKLSPAEKARVIDELIKSLDQPDEEMDKIWMKEGESRIDAYDRGELKTVTVEEAFLKYKSKP